MRTLPLLAVVISATSLLTACNAGDKFSGTLESYSMGCIADGECFAVVDGKHVTTTMGWSTEVSGDIIGLQPSRSITEYIGQEVDVYARKADENSYTLYGSTEYYIQVDENAELPPKKLQKITSKIDLVDVSSFKESATLQVPRVIASQNFKNIEVVESEEKALAQALKKRFIQSDAEIPFGQFKAYYFNSEYPTKEPVKTQTTSDIDVKYSWEKGPGFILDSEDFGGYWIGKFESQNESIYSFNVKSSWSDTYIFINGKQVHSGIGSADIQLEAGEHAVEVVHMNNWHTTDLQVDMSIRKLPNAQIIQSLQEIKENFSAITTDVDFQTIYISVNASSRDDSVINITTKENLVKPTILVLNSSKYVDWNIIGTIDNLIGVVISSPEQSTITNLDDSIPVASLIVPHVNSLFPVCYSYADFQSGNCKDLYSFNKANETLQLLHSKSRINGFSYNGAVAEVVIPTVTISEELYTQINQYADCKLEAFSQKINKDKNDECFVPEEFRSNQISNAAKVYVVGAYQSQDNQANITLNTDSPVVLVLMSYDETNWVISDPNNKLERLIVSGYEEQKITGVNANLQPDVYTYEDSTCASCIKRNGFFLTHFDPKKSALYSQEDEYDVLNDLGDSSLRSIVKHELETYKADKEQYETVIKKIEGITGRTANYNGAYEISAITINENEVVIEGKDDVAELNQGLRKQIETEIVLNRPVEEGDKISQFIFEDFPKEGYAGQDNGHKLRFGKFGNIFDIDTFIWMKDKDLNGPTRAVSAQISEDQLPENITIQFSQKLIDPENMQLVYTVTNSGNQKFDPAKFFFFIDPEILEVDPVENDDMTFRIDEYMVENGTKNANSPTNWEIDEPGFDTGDIFDHLREGKLDGKNSTSITRMDDVAAAFEFDIIDLKPGSSVKYEVHLSTNGKKNNDFYIQHYDQRLSDVLTISAKSL